MKSAFSVDLGGQEEDVVVEALGHDGYRVTVGQRSIELVAREISPRHYQLLDSAHVHDVVVTGRRPAVTVHNRVGSTLVSLLDEAQLARRSSAGSRAGNDGAICAPMPGKVVKALVAVGDEVVEGQGVIIVEAMKMENELRSPRDGVVRELLVEQGSSVDAGQKLVVID